jgi:hypothetical protein
MKITVDHDGTRLISNDCNLSYSLSNYLPSYKPFFVEIMYLAVAASPKICPWCLGAGDQPFSGDCWLPGASKFLDRTFCGKYDYAIHYTTAASAFPRMRILPRKVSDNTLLPPPFTEPFLSFPDGQNTCIPALLQSYMTKKLHVLLNPAGLRRRFLSFRKICENIVYFWKRDKWLC